MFIVVAYDIPDDKRRTRVMKILEGYGYRVQKSVFECEVTPQLYDKMRGRVGKAIDESEDSVRYYSLCARCLGEIRIAGLGVVERDRPYFAV